jgi:glyoxylase-like metal-dependent hydrolase (beta-lactamase superfamily II)
MQFSGIDILTLADQRDVLHPVVIGKQKDYVLVDSGFPGMSAALQASLESTARNLEDVGAIICTHHDLDHIGGVNAIRALAPQVPVYAHAAEVPYLEGHEPPQKLRADELRMAERGEHATSEQRAFFAMLKQGFANSIFTVNRVLEGGECLRFPGASPIRVVNVPGHTPGHIALFVEEHGVLIAGDALTVREGELHGPQPQFCDRLEQAYDSIVKLQNLPIRAVICYHGGLFDGDVSTALQRIIEDYAKEDHRDD